MKILVLVLFLSTLAVAVMSTTPSENKRTERSIRDWFSGIFKRFQKKENRRQPFYLQQTYQPYPSYHSHHYQEPYQHSSFGYSSGGFGGHDHGGGHGGGHVSHHGGGHGDIHGGGHGVGHGGGHGVGHEGGYVGGHGDLHGGGHGVGHGEGFAGGHDVGHGGGHGGGHGNGHGSAHIPHGFGPLKSSDVIHHDGLGISDSFHGHDHSGEHGNQVDLAYKGQNNGHADGSGVGGGHLHGGGIGGGGGGDHLHGGGIGGGGGGDHLHGGGIGGGGGGDHLHGGGIGGGGGGDHLHGGGIGGGGGGDHLHGGGIGGGGGGDHLHGGGIGGGGGGDHLHGGGIDGGGGGGHFQGGGIGGGHLHGGGIGGGGGGGHHGGGIDGGHLHGGGGGVGGGHLHGGGGVGGGHLHGGGGVGGGHLHGGGGGVGGGHLHGGGGGVGGGHGDIHGAGPVVPEVDISYEGPAGPQLDYDTADDHHDGHSLHVPPSNSISAVSSQQYIPPTNVPLPLEQKEGEVYLDSTAHGPVSSKHHFSPLKGSHPPDLYTLAAGINNQVVVSGRPGESVFAPHLGPNDPIIEIVFQDGKPVAPHPLPVIDDSLYDPVSDDVEVFFIEYSPEDNLDDLKNLDLSSAQPAVLQNLPAGLPYELRNHLLNSGVLENAQIEIIDLDKALTDKSLDTRTRTALQQAYSRTNRQVVPPDFAQKKKDNNQAVDIRVQRLNHDRRTPEGIVEFLSGLKTFRKGTFAGVVEVNDEKTNKFLPVTVDGNRLPLPDNIPLSKKKVDGVLVLAPESERKGREAKVTFTKGRQIQSSPPKSLSTPINTKRRRLLDIDWADMDTNGWIPILNVDT